MLVLGCGYGKCVYVVLLDSSLILGRDIWIRARPGIPKAGTSSGYKEVILLADLPLWMPDVIYLR